MSTHRIYRATSVTLAGVISTSPVTGWVLRLMAVSGSGETLLKTSADPEQISLNEDTGAFEIFLTAEDTAEARNISTRLRAQDGDEHHVLASDLIEIAD